MQALMDETTIAQAIDAYGVELVGEFNPDELVPVLTGVQFQGDIAVRPVESVSAPVKLTAAGTTVADDGDGGNAHVLVPGIGSPEASVRVGVAEGDPHVVALLEVDEGSVAILTHPEHGYSGIGPGSYELRRQREQSAKRSTAQDSDESRLVVD